LAEPPQSPKSNHHFIPNTLEKATAAVAHAISSPRSKINTAESTPTLTKQASAGELPSSESNVEIKEGSATVKERPKKKRKRINRVFSSLLSFGRDKDKQDK
jgi:hypothetical protein